MKTAKALFILLLLFACAPAFAQFSIKETPKSEIPLEVIEKRDTVIAAKGYKWDYVNDTERHMQKLARRKERNYLELATKLSFSQTSFDNWASGGDNTLMTLLRVDFKHTHKRERFNFETNFNTKYGLNYIDKHSFKNEDEFRINLKSDWKMHDNWSFSQSANLRSQYAIGHDNRTDTVKRSAFMAPGTLDLSVGITYKKRPLTIEITPVGGNARFVLDKELSDQGKHGVEKGKRSRWQAGPSLRVTFEDEYFNKVVHVKSIAYSFSNLKGDPTLDWWAEVRIKATKFLSTTIYGQVRYDQYASTPKPESFQYKYAITVDLGYTFKNK